MNKEATLTVEKSRLFRTNKGDAKVTAETLDVRNFETDPATVVVSTARTVNIGNYESLHVKVEYQIPCYVEEARGIAHKLSNHVTSQTDSIVNDWQAYLKENK